MTRQGEAGVFRGMAGGKYAPVAVSEQPDEPAAPHARNEDIKYLCRGCVGEFDASQVWHLTTCGCYHHSHEMQYCAKCLSAVTECETCGRSVLPNADLHKRNMLRFATRCLSFSCCLREAGEMDLLTNVFHATGLFGISVTGGMLLMVITDTFLLATAKRVTSHVIFMSLLYIMVFISLIYLAFMAIILLTVGIRHAYYNFQQWIDREGRKIDRQHKRNFVERQPEV
jgi:hypothetical protein